MKPTYDNPINWRVKVTTITLLILAFPSTSFCYQQESIGQEIIAEIDQKNNLEVQKDIDQQLHQVFAKFFDEHDTTPFGKIIAKIITILKTKKSILQGHTHTKCEELIKTFEKNKHNLSFPVWGKILIAPELMELMSEENRAYLKTIPDYIKVKTLLVKLQNNRKNL